MRVHRSNKYRRTYVVARLSLRCVNVVYLLVNPRSCFELGVSLRSGLAANVHHMMSVPCQTEGCPIDMLSCEVGKLNEAQSLGLTAVSVCAQQHRGVLL